MSAATAGLVLGTAAAHCGGLTYSSREENKGVVSAESCFPFNSKEITCINVMAGPSQHSRQQAKVRSQNGNFLVFWRVEKHLSLRTQPTQSELAVELRFPQQLQVLAFVPLVPPARQVDFELAFGVNLLVPAERAHVSAFKLVVQVDLLPNLRERLVRVRKHLVRRPIPEIVEFVDRSRVEVVFYSLQHLSLF